MSTRAAANQKFVNFGTLAVVAQLVERIHGKDEVSGSIPDDGSILNQFSKKIDMTNLIITV